MLDHSDGRSCQASNFLRAFRTLREASALGLLLNWEGEEQRADYGKLIQNWNRFVLQQLNQVCTCGGCVHVTGCVGVMGCGGEGALIPSFSCLLQETQPVPASPEGQTGSGEGNEGASVMQRLFGSEVETVSVCRCEWSSTRRSTELLFSLLYPHNVPGEGSKGRGESTSGGVSHSTSMNVNGSMDASCSTDGRVDDTLTSGHANPSKSDAGAREKTSFGSVLERSICRQQRIHGWCEQCAKYKSTVGTGTVELTFHRFER